MTDAVRSAAGERATMLRRRFLRTRTGPFFGGLLLVLITVTILAPLLAPHSPIRQYLDHTLEPPSVRFPLGTDDLGRDLLSRLLHGGRITLLAAFVSVGAATAIGLPVGMISGMLGGRGDIWIMHGVNALLSFPSVLLAFAISALIGPSLAVVVLAISIVFAPRMARFARGQTLVVRETPFVEAARATGASLRRLIFRHVLPNIAAPMLVEASLGVGYAALIEASISFLGAGIQPPRSSWGLMIKEGFGYMDSAPWVAIAPGAAILLLTLCVNVLGDTVRDVFDPKVRL
ncbi:MAG: ABC transporter permease [bacterium]|nr:ABC transporter permease [bacterium]